MASQKEWFPAIPTEDLNPTDSLKIQKYYLYTNNFIDINSRAVICKLFTQIAVMNKKIKNSSKKACISSIIAILTRTSQHWRYKRLTQAVRRRELTTSLEILAESGIEEDLAVFIIANLQYEVAA